MAKRKDEEAEGKGFQIPIEDGVEDASEAEGAEAVEDAPEAGLEEDPQADEDIVAEAEAVVEEAAAADELEKARQEASDWQDRYLRLHAEWDTYRRRMTEQRAEEKARATEKLMENLLPVLDDFERTVSYATENGETGLLDGVKAVQTKLLDALSKGGLVIIDPANERRGGLRRDGQGRVSKGLQDGQEGAQGGHGHDHDRRTQAPEGRRSRRVNASNSSQAARCWKPRMLRCDQCPRLGIVRAIALIGRRRFGRPLHKAARQKECDEHAAHVL